MLAYVAVVALRFMDGGVVYVGLYINCGCLVSGGECDVAVLGCGGLLD